MDIFKHLKDNKAALIAEKKFKLKFADAISYSTVANNVKDVSVKELNTEDLVDLTSIKVSVVINSTNLMDSHNDVHMVGIWNKSLKEQKSLYLLQEHQMSFDKIITDNLKASVKNLPWADLGYSELKGNSQALIFDAVIDANRNPFMFEQYLKGYVKNHSVGMQYINMTLCINSTEKYYVEEKANFDKYIIDVANKQNAIDAGFFWAVTEAKIIEGSAVVRGSNQATPTLSMTSTKEIEADIITSNNEPVKATQEQIRKQFFINQLKTIK